MTPNPRTNTRITDEGFSYSVRGEATDVYQKAPNSGGYYHVNAADWESGALKQLAGLAGLPAITYSPDSQGRVNSITAGGWHTLSSLF